MKKSEPERRRKGSGGCVDLLCGTPIPWAQILAESLVRAALDELFLIMQQITNIVLIIFIII